MVTLFVLFINSKTEIEIFIIAAKTTILFHTGMNYSCKRGYIIPSRIDLHCEVPVVPFKDLSQMKPGEPSSAIRERVIRAAGHPRPQHPDRALPFFPPVGGTEGDYPLQCADDGAHDPPVCRARCRLIGNAPHGYGEAEALRSRLQPHPQGGPHHCRPRRKRKGRSHAHRRSYRV